MQSVQLQWEVRPNETHADVGTKLRHLFRAVCGGSRARAWAVTGDYLAEDPSCVHRPAASPA